MIINYKNFSKVDFSQYKRVFIFGCSFTNYTWPTWANILSYETKEDTEIYNFGLAGGGNLFITERISAANQKYKFNDRDLVLVMWSTFSREDRYLNGAWITPGNIWTQGFYPDEWIEKYTCVRGYIVRDLGLISMTNNALSYLPCHAIVLKSVDPHYDNRYYTGTMGLDDVINLYDDVMSGMPLALHDFANDGGGGWVNGHHYHWDAIKSSSPENPFSDYHPNPKMYMDYLKKIGFNLSEATGRKVLDYQAELLTLKDRNAIEQWFGNLVNENPRYHSSVKLV